MIRGVDLYMRMKKLKDKMDAYYEWEKDHEDKVEYYKKILSDPIIDFIVEANTARIIQDISREELAKKMNLPTAEIDKFENMMILPTVDFMKQLAEALGGRLFITIYGDYTVTVPLEYHKKLNDISESKNKSVKEVLLEMIIAEIKRNDDTT